MLTGALLALAAITVHVRSPLGLPLKRPPPLLLLLALYESGHVFAPSRVCAPLGQKGARARRFAGEAHTRAAGRRPTGRCGRTGVVVQVEILRYF